MARALSATRYVVPLREGGSLPAIIDTEHDGLWVVKFRGAGQGAKALVAELIVAGLARALELPVPETALIDLDASFGRTEPDPEIQDILKGSRGLNVGMRYLEGAFNFDPHSDEVDPDLAAAIVWLDALVTNIDRTFKNPNLMWHDDGLWLIDHGAALYFHHDWSGVSDETARRPFARIADHVLLGRASDLSAADARLGPMLSRDRWQPVLDALPDELLMDSPEGVSPPFATAADNREAYARFLETRLASPRTFVSAAADAKARARSGVGEKKSYRR